jgi:ADP-ribose pyrophosphatase YjhB (NUDIX family)
MVKKYKERKKTTSCGGVVWRSRNGRLELLLVKQFANKERWGIPKGHVHEGETLEECAIREIREETGVSTVLGTRLPAASITYKDEDKTVVSWLATCIGNDEPKHDDPDSEVADARWFDISALPEIIVYQRQLIVKAIDLLIAVTNLKKSVGLSTE